MARSVNRSAGTGRFVKAATAQRNPATTTTERVGSGTKNNKTVHRSAESGQFVSKATAARNPSKTIAQRV